MFKQSTNFNLPKSHSLCLGYTWSEVSCCVDFGEIWNCYRAYPRGIYDGQNLHWLGIFFAKLSASSRPWSVRYDRPANTLCPQNPHLNLFQVFTAGRVKMPAFCDIAPCSFMVAVSASETLVFCETTLLNIPDAFHFPPWTDYSVVQNPEFVLWKISG